MAEKQKWIDLGVVRKGIEPKSSRAITYRTADLSYQMKGEGGEMVARRETEEERKERWRIELEIGTETETETGREIEIGVEIDMKIEVVTETGNPTATTDLVSGRGIGTEISEIAGIGGEEEEEVADVMMIGSEPEVGILIVVQRKTNGKGMVIATGKEIEMVTEIEIETDLDFRPVPLEIRSLTRKVIISTVLMQP